MTKTFSRLTLSAITFFSVISSAALAEKIPFVYRPLPLDVCVLSVPEEGPELQMAQICPLVAQSVSTCLANRGQVGMIGNLAVCRETRPAIARQVEAVGRRPPPSDLGNPPPYNPSEAEMLSFRPWTPPPPRAPTSLTKPSSPTRPPIP
jgi:hypothetical protein